MNAYTRARSDQHWEKRGPITPHVGRRIPYRKTTSLAKQLQHSPHTAATAIWLQLQVQQLFHFSGITFIGVFHNSTSQWLDIWFGISRDDDESDTTETHFKHHIKGENLTFGIFIVPGLDLVKIFSGDSHQIQNGQIKKLLQMETNLPLFRPMPNQNCSESPKSQKIKKKC